MILRHHNDLFGGVSVGANADHNETGGTAAGPAQGRIDLLPTRCQDLVHKSFKVTIVRLRGWSGASLGYQDVAKTPELNRMNAHMTILCAARDALILYSYVGHGPLPHCQSPVKGNATLPHPGT
jgi:hypothetical protein